MAQPSGPTPGIARKSEAAHRRDRGIGAWSIFASLDPPLHTARWPQGLVPAGTRIDEFGPATDVGWRRPSVHVRSVEVGHLSVRLSGHEHEARSGLRIDHRKRATRSENGNLRAARSPCVGAEACLSFQQVHEAVELRRDRAAEDSAPRQLDVQDEPRGPKFDRRAFPYQHPHDRLTFLPDGHVLRIEELRARLDSLVLARQVHPKEDSTHLGSGLALSELVFADPFGVPHAAPRSELQERSGLQPRTLHRATWTSLCRLEPFTTEELYFYVYVRYESWFTSVGILLSLSPPITPTRALALRTQTVLLSDPSRNPTLTRLRDC